MSRATKFLLAVPFRWVTCPQYLGEILSFTGFAIMTWNLGAVFVLAMTAGNLIPAGALYPSLVS
jgi:3-oxo-5-alpha-steroid 4-dehydrogenase 1